MFPTLIRTGAALLALSALASAQGLVLPPSFTSVELTTSFQGADPADATTVRVEANGSVTLTSPTTNTTGTLDAAELNGLSRLIVALRLRQVPNDITGPQFPLPPDPLALLAISTFQLEVNAPGDLGGLTGGQLGWLDPQYEPRVQPVIDALTRIKMQFMFGAAPTQHGGVVRVERGRTYIDQLGTRSEVTPRSMARDLAPLAGRSVSVMGVSRNGELDVRSIEWPIPTGRRGTLSKQGDVFSVTSSFPGIGMPEIQVASRLTRALDRFVGDEVLLQGFDLGFGQFLATSMSGFTSSQAEFFRYVNTPAGWRYTVIANLHSSAQVQIFGLSRSGRSFRVYLPFQGEEGYIAASKVAAQGLSAPMPFTAPATSGLAGAVGGQ